MFNYRNNDVQTIYEAKSITEAIRAYNHNCETCLGYGCKGEFCPAAKALKRVSNRREFKNDMKDPEIRKQLKMYLDDED